MPNLPSFRTSQTRTGTRAIPTEAPLPKPTPLPVSAADVGAGAVAEGLSQLGRGLGEVGQDLFAIEMEKQRIRDELALSVSGAGLNKFSADEIETATRKTYTDIEQFKQDRENFSTNYDAEVERLAAKMSERAANKFRNSSRLHKQIVTNDMKRVWWPKEIAFGQESAVEAVSERYRAIIKDATLDQMKNDVIIKALGKGSKDYWTTGQFERRRDRALISVLRQNGRYDDAIKLANTTKAFKTEEEREASIKNTKNAQSAGRTQAKAQLKELQEQTAIEFSGRIAQVETVIGATALMTDIDIAIANEALDRKVGEGYKRELISGREVPTDWNVYNQLDLDIISVRDGIKDFLEVYNEIQTHRGKDINGDQIDDLTARTRTAKSIAEGELPSVAANALTRFQRILTAYHNAGMWGDISDEDKLPEAAAKYADKAAQLDKFYAETKPTFREAEDFFKQLTEDAEKEGLFEKLWKRIGTIEPTLLGFQIAADAQKNKLKELGNQERLELDARNIGDIEIINGENWKLIRRGDTPAEDVWQKQ